MFYHDEKGERGVPLGRRAAWHTEAAGFGWRGGDAELPADQRGEARAGPQVGGERCRSAPAEQVALQAALGLAIKFGGRPGATVARTASRPPARTLALERRNYRFSPES